jgi:RimJ/RimL family protein N-acetyltransferase
VKYPKLIPVDPKDYGHLGFLFGVLALRLEEPYTNISHSKMPSWDQHCRFLRNWPYIKHFIITAGNQFLGVCYISKQNEVGIYICPDYRCEGVATWVIGELIKSHDGPLSANIAPKNPASIRLFRKLGFELKETEPTQLVYTHAGKQSTL